MSWYNENHRAQKNLASRQYMRKRNHIVKKNKKPTREQAQATRRHLRMELKLAEAELYLLQYLNTPTIPLQSNEIWRPNPGVS